MEGWKRISPIFFGKLGALIHFSTKCVLKNSSHLKHEIGLDGRNTWDIQESSQKSYDQLPPSQAFPNCEAGPEEEVVLELPMGAGSDGFILWGNLKHNTL